ARANRARRLGLSSGSRREAGILTTGATGGATVSRRSTGSTVCATSFAPYACPDRRSFRLQRYARGRYAASARRGNSFSFSGRRRPWGALTFGGTDPLPRAAQQPGRGDEALGPRRGEADAQQVLAAFEEE